MSSKAICDSSSPCARHTRSMACGRERVQRWTVGSSRNPVETGDQYPNTPCIYTCTWRRMYDWYTSTQISIRLTLHIHISYISKYPNTPRMAYSSTLHLAAKSAARSAHVRCPRVDSWPIWVHQLFSVGTNCDMCDMFCAPLLAWSVVF